MTAGIITPAVLEWAERAAPGARVTGCTVHQLAGGAIERALDEFPIRETSNCHDDDAQA